MAMAERSLRGMRLGSNSLESADHVKFVERKQAEYLCPNGHQFAVTLAADADLPATWMCKCGAKAELQHDKADIEEKKKKKQQRTHWDMLRERREIDELQVLLEERLDLLHQGKLRLHDIH